MSWKYDYLYDEDDQPIFKNKLKKLEKKHKDEIIELYDLLERLILLLNTGKSIGSLVNQSWLKKVGEDLWEIRYGKKGKLALRLYFHNDDSSEIILLVNIGEKDRQSNDIEVAKDLVGQYLSGKVVE